MKGIAPREEEGKKWRMKMLATAMRAKSQTEKTPEMDERRGNRRRVRREEGMAPWKQGEIS